jgi:outer membrane protein
MRTLALALLSLSLASLSNAADLKVGVVDMSKCMAEFHKAKEAQATIKANSEKAMAELNERYAALKTLTGDVMKLQKQAQDPILTEAAKAKAGADYVAKAKEGRALEQEISEFQQKRSMQLRQESMQQQKGLNDQIVEVVKRKSKDSSFDFVFDRSGLAVSGVPVLLYFKDATDFSDEVIVELNKDAAAAPAKEEKKTK